MSREDVIRLREGYAAFNRGDLDAILKTLDPEVVFIQAEELPGAEIYHGHEGVRKWLADLTAAFDDFRVEPEELIDAGDETRELGRGSFVCVPPGVVHTFSNPGEDRVRFLNFNTPPGGSTTCAISAPPSRKAGRCRPKRWVVSPRVTTSRSFKRATHLPGGPAKV
jgi:hypothetical protein